MSKFIKGTLSITIMMSFSCKALALKVCIDSGHMCHDLQNSGPVFTDSKSGEKIYAMRKVDSQLSYTKGYKYVYKYVKESETKKYEDNKWKYVKWDYPGDGKGPIRRGLGAIWAPEHYTRPRKQN
jgi:hypothetical protein